MRVLLLAANQNCCPMEEEACRNSREAGKFMGAANLFAGGGNQKK
jgi:hypothetical protein